MVNTRLKIFLISVVVIQVAIANCADAKIKINADTIKIILENKDSVILANKNPNGDGYVRYSYEGFDSGINFHKISKIGYETRGSEIISNKNGKRYGFEETEIKVFHSFKSKNDPYYLIAKYEGNGISKIDIYDFKEDQLVQSRQDKILSGSKCWYFGKISWSNSSISIQRIFPNSKKQNSYQKILSEYIELKNGKWVLNQKVHIKENCEIDSATTDREYLNFFE